MTGARVTVVIITRNRKVELLRTLERMTALPDQAPVVVVDNGSTDHTAETVTERFGQVTLLRSACNLGAQGRNLAVRDIDTRYVAFCDDDTRWRPGALTRAADLLDEHPELASVTGRILVAPAMTEDPITPELRNSPIPGPAWLPGPALLGVLAGASMFRVAAFRQVGGFSPRLWLGGEEELLALDLAAAGWWMCWAPDVVIEHEPSVCRDPRRRRQLGIRNTLWTAWLRRPLPSALRRTGTMLRSVPRDWASVMAFAEALGGLAWVVRERRVVPPDVEHGLQLLEEPQRHSPARRYVG
ncbi:MAG: glycosyltransferase [Actinomycetota bacterium]|nr:glycosyltransferase [Actinomycetota bacterium]